MKPHGQSPDPPRWWAGLAGVPAPLLGAALGLPGKAVPAAGLGALWPLLVVLTPLLLVAWLVGACQARLPPRLPALALLLVTILAAYLSATLGPRPDWGLALLGFGAALVPLLLTAVALRPRGPAPALPASQTDDLDQLTGFLTRQGFERRRATLTSGHWSLALLDVNRLKTVNTLHGHTGGDAYLFATAQALRRQLPAALLCRWGGDEFLALIPDDGEGESRAALLQASRAAPQPLAGLPAFAFGLSRWSPGESFERAVILADHQLYAAKAALDDVPEAAPRHSLHDFARRLEELVTPQEIIQQGLVLLRELLDFDLAQYSGYDGQVILRDYAELRAGLELPGLGSVSPTPHGELTRRALEQARTVVSVDYPADPLAVPFWLKLGAKSIIMTPVLEADRVVGLLSLIHISSWHTVTPQVQQVVELAALRLGHALELQRLKGQLRALQNTGG